MTLSDITRVGVLGAGQMGRGIAQVAAASGWEVWLFDTKAEALEAALGRIRQGLDRAVEKGTVKADQMRAILERLRPVSRLRDFDEVPLIIEAVPEELEMKLRQLWAMRHEEGERLKKAAQRAQRRAEVDGEEIARLLGCDNEK